MRSQRR